MDEKVFIIRGFLHGRRQQEERFTSEVRARHRAAYLGRIYDSVMLGQVDPPATKANRLQPGHRGNIDAAANH